jgi:DNA modification methylase
MAYFQVINDDARDALSLIPDRSIQCCITSPPYWGLRDYGHVKQIGSEETLDLYIERLITIFREVRRVLADDGVLWLNLGDSYAARSMSIGDSVRLKSKDLIGLPFRIAFALQDDGWYLRQDIVWAKPNAMPESVRDRCTKSHEFIFMLTKQSRYFFDQDSIKERSVSFKERSDVRSEIQNIKGNMSERGVTRTTEGLNMKSQAQKTKPFRNRRDVWFVATESFKGTHFAVMPRAIVLPCLLASSRLGDTVLDPFAGASTVGVVALSQNRNFIGIELNSDYVKLSTDRLQSLNTMKEGE